MAAKITRLRRP
jgi:hypothetical protein